ncbi:neuroglian-like [Cotesia typhae]|uniref:neuroglian-like n=1 Tax=Cotesia typhae TaxID=2053667 RepID=UPI003D68E91D
MKRSIFMLLALIAIDASSSEELSPPRLVKQPPKDELLFQVARPDEDHKSLVIECEAEGYPAPA